MKPKKPTGPTEEILFSTVRIETQLKNGRRGSGTGFVFQGELKPGVPFDCLVTNRHVIADATGASGRFHVVGAAAQEVSERTVSVSLGGPEAWTMHPTTKVDLCARPLPTSRGPARNVAIRHSGLASAAPTSIPTTSFSSWTRWRTS